MSDLTELVLEGDLCQTCHTVLDNEDFEESPGFARWCQDCAPDDLEQDQKCLVDGGFLNE